MKRYFVTFANSRSLTTKPPRYEIHRLVAEAKRSRYFDRVIGYDEDCLDKKFWLKHQQFIANHPRGFGCWIWKPQVVWQILQQMKNGDVLCYADAGCRVVRGWRAQKRMADYHHLLTNNKLGILVFQLLHHQEKHWSKRDLLRALSADQPAMMASPQVMATIFFLRKSPATMKLVKQWLAVAQDYHLIDDSPSKAKNDKNFREHRHDQSIFSILVKQAGAVMIPDETLQRPPFYSVPIITRRHKIRSPLWVRLYQKMVPSRSLEK